jgi:hypothetical protein
VPLFLFFSRSSLAHSSYTNTPGFICKELAGMHPVSFSHNQQDFIHSSAWWESPQENISPTASVSTLGYSNVSGQLHNIKGSTCSIIHRICFPTWTRVSKATSHPLLIDYLAISTPAVAPAGTISLRLTNQEMGEHTKSLFDVTVDGELPTS